MSSNTPANTTMAPATPHFCGIAAELRTDIAEHHIARIRNFYIKSRFTKAKSNKPYHDQWFFSTSPLICACRLSNEAIYIAIRHRAIYHYDSQIVCRVRNFNFRTLMAWIDTLSQEEKAVLDSLTTPKVLVQLDLSDAGDFDAGKLGQWLSFRGRKNSNPEVEYKFRQVKRAESLVDQLYRTEQAVGNDDPDMVAIATAGMEWVQRWEDGVEAGTRDADGDAEENEGDVDLWGPQDEYTSEEYDEVLAYHEQGAVSADSLQ